MVRNILLAMSLLFAALHGEPEYDILLLAPVNGELTTKNEIENEIILNEAGYIGGEIKIEDGDTYRKELYIYHKDLGFNLIPLPEKAVWGELRGINKNGIVVGVYDETHYSHCRNFPMIFVYNVHNGECFDLLDAFGFMRRDKENFLLDSCIWYSDLVLCLTDDNKIVVDYRNDKYFHKYKSQSFVFDLDNNTIDFPNLEGITKVNQSGQMIGEKKVDYSFHHNDNPVTQSWFYDPLTGRQELGSLDKFGRWKAIPYVISSNGIVAGIGYNSFYERMGFIWTQAEGFKEFDIDEDNVKMNAINENGHIVGSSNDWYGQAFLYTPECGYISLAASEWYNSEAFDLNNQTQVIGYSRLDNDKNVAFIWDFIHGMRELTALIPQDAGWKELNKAFRINNSGYIVGTGNYYGINHNFLLIPKTQIEN